MKKIINKLRQHENLSLDTKLSLNMISYGRQESKFSYMAICLFEEEGLLKSLFDLSEISDVTCGHVFLANKYKKSSNCSGL